VSFAVVRSFSAVFFGTPEFAVPCLDALHALADVRALVCQPDKPSGRGMVLAPPPTKVRATELGIPVLQPTKLRTGEFAATLRALEVDVALVVAYGRILPLDVLQAPRLGCVNVHGSILPKYRGAAPIQWAVANGDEETGVTLMQMDEGMDTGDMLHIARTPLGPNETSLELGQRLSQLGAALVTAELPRFVQGLLTRQVQDASLATVAPILKKDDGRLDFAMPARAVHNRVRAMVPWPGAKAMLQGKTIKVLETSLVDEKSEAMLTEGAPGQVLIADKHGVIVQCRGLTRVRLVRVQLEGKKPVSASDWVAGRGVRAGDVLGS
jgi:methionyl-tRNA formyltransferase